jgi:hypothetical protein
VTTDPDRRNEAWIRAQRRKVAQRYPEAPPPPVKSKRKPPIKKPMPYWSRAKLWFDEWIHDKGAPAPRSQEYTALVEHILQMLQDRGDEPVRRTVERKVKGRREEYLATLSNGRDIR